MSEGFDLLGDPISEPDEKRGRPEHTPTETKRSYVLACIAQNWTHDQIAAAIGVTGKTLRKYYSRELRGGKAMLRAALYVKLQEQINVGNVSAIRLAHQLFEKADLTRAAAAWPAKEAKSAVPGKKELAAAAAKSAGDGTEWGEDLRTEALLPN